MKRVWLPAVGCVVGACAAGDGPSAVTRVDSAGVEIVTYAGPDVPLTWTFDSLFALGGSEDGEDSFYDVRGGVVGVDRAGNLFVLDTDAKRIVVFDSTGAFVRAMGGPGGGPGEMEWPIALTVMPDGSAAVYDLGKGGLVTFGPGGEIREQIPLRAGYQGGGIRGTGAGMVFPRRVWNGDVSDPGRDELVRVHDGDTTRLLSVAGPPGRVVEFKSCGMSISGVPPVFWPSLRWAAADTLLAVATQASYEVMLLQGPDTTHLIRRSLEPLPATTAAATREIGDRFRVMTSGGERACATDEVVEQLGIAERIPLIAEIADGPDDTWWVRRRDAQGVDVFTTAGDYLGTLPGSAPYPVVTLPGDRIAGIVTDELDVERLVIYRVVKAGP